jgi:large subunit ribosomal protein L5
MNYTPNLKTKYRAEIVKSLQKEFDYKSSMQVPKLTKICLNQGIGSAVSDKKMIDAAVVEMTTISGQKAVVKAFQLAFALHCAATRCMNSWSV